MRSNPRPGQNNALAAMLGRTWIDLSLAAGRGIKCSTEPNLEASSLEEASIMGSNASPRLDLREPRPARTTPHGRGAEGHVSWAFSVKHWSFALGTDLCARRAPGP